MRIIIAEDHAMIRDILIMALRRGSGYQVEGYSTAQESIEACLDRADLAIFDHRLPDLTGIEALAKLRADPRTADLPIIVITGEHDTATRMEAISAGATEFLTKPVDIEEFRLRVRNLLALQQALKSAKDKRDLLETLISRSDAAIAVADATGSGRELLYLSEALKQLLQGLGVSQPETAFDILAGPDAQSGQQSQLVQALEQCRNGSFAFAHAPVDAPLCWHEITVQAVPAEGAEARFLVIGCKDISRMMEMRADLTRVQDRLTDIARMSGVWFFELDEQLCLSYVSDGMAKAFAITPDQVLGRHVDTLGVRLKDSPSGKVPLSMALQQAGEKALHALLSFKLPDGSLRAVQVSMAPFQTAEGVFAGFRGYGGDVSALAEARDQAQRASQAKSAFLATLSHELRTPLTAILGMADLLEQDNHSGKGIEHLAHIRKAATELGEVLGDALDVARMEDGPLQLNPSPFDIAPVLDEAVRPHRILAERRGLELALEVTGDLSGQRIGDGERLGQVIRHLLSNAVKFTLAGRVLIAVDLSSREQIVITVSDTGIGIAQDQIARAFEPFQQLDDSVARRFAGQGVGLSIAHWLVGSMQGRLDLTSTEGEGTTVTVTLPVAKVVAQRSAPDCASLEGRSVLVTDDSAANRRILDMMLRKLDANVTLCEDGASTLQLLPTQNFDMLLLDINMPEMDGVELMRQIRKREASLGMTPVPAMAVTANAMPDQVRTYLEAGFNDCLSKPFTLNRLQEKLCKLV